MPLHLCEWWVQVHATPFVWVMGASACHSHKWSSVCICANHPLSPPVHNVGKVGKLCPITPFFLHHFAIQKHLVPWKNRKRLSITLISKSFYSDIRGEMGTNYFLRKLHIHVTLESWHTPFITLLINVDWTIYNSKTNI